MQGFHRPALDGLAQALPEPAIELLMIEYPLHAAATPPTGAIISCTRPVLAGIALHGSHSLNTSEVAARIRSSFKGATG